MTIKEIAEMAGVHRATVDKVLHNRVGVSDDVRRRIQKIIDQVGYTPNPVGRALQKQGDTFRLAAVLVQVDALEYLRRGIEKAVAELPGFNIELSFDITKFQECTKQSEIIKRLVDEKVHGIILSPMEADCVRSAINYAAAAGIPVITTNSDIKDSKRMCYVGQDGARGARIAGRLMGEFLDGKGKVAIVTSSIDSENNNFYLHIREHAFTAFLNEQYPAICIVKRLESLEDPRITFEKTVALLEREPELRGIYITCGGVAEVGRALWLSGREKEIKVISFEDYPEILRLLRDGVIDCTLSSDLDSQGSLPVQLIMNYLVYGSLPPGQRRYTETKILVKESIV